MCCLCAACVQDSALAVGPTRFIMSAVYRDIRGGRYAGAQLERAMLDAIYEDRVPHCRMGAGCRMPDAPEGGCKVPSRDHPY
jgi:hypothetical protein